MINLKYIRQDKKKKKKKKDLTKPNQSLKKL